jgi:hypothetical protein
VIDRVAVRRFKRLSNLECTLAQVSALVGSNNSGKTSLLQAIHFGVCVANSVHLFSNCEWKDDSLDIELPFRQLLYSPSDHADGLFDGTGQPIEIELGSESGACRIQVEAKNAGVVHVSIQGRSLGDQLQQERLFSMYAPGLAGIARREQLVSAGVLSHAVAAGDANRVFRNVLFKLSQDRAAWALFENSIRQLFPDLEIQVKLGLADKYISVEMREGGDRWLPVESAGNGILQAAQLLSYVALFTPAVLILDEPDSHLHPDNQRRLCRLLVTLAQEREMQVLFATHSRHVLDAAQGDVEFVWVNNGSIAPLKQTEFTPVLLDIGALDKLDFVLSKHPRCVVATEDTDLDLLKSLLQANDFKMEDVEILSYSGCTKVHAAVVLAEWLRISAPGITLVVHIDSDYRTPDEIAQLETELTAPNMKAFVTPGNDIEHSFLSSAHLAAVTGVPAEDIAAKLGASVADTSDKSKAAIVRQRTDRALKKTPGKIDSGAISVAAHNEFDADPSKMCHGKTVLGRMKAELPNELGSNARHLDKSEFIRIAALEAIAHEIWR